VGLLRKAGDLVSEHVLKKKRSQTQKKGFAAETVAADHLLNLGYRIVDRNFSCKLGEIDLIAKHNGELVFVEVKSRYSVNSQDPIYSIDGKKQARIAKAAQVYLDQNYRNPVPARFDVAVVTMEPVPDVEVIPNAFSVDELDPWR
jgi:putative endonuclease